MSRRFFIAMAALSTTAAPAFAHVGAEHGSLMSGLAHPFSGADHLLAMIAVGLWAAQLGGRARFAVPAAFASVMVLGFGLALFGMALPFVEPAILASVIGLGLLVALAVKIPTYAGAAIVSVFALFHGHAHGAELGGASALTFGLGFLASTIILHAIGLLAGTSLSARLATGARLAGGLTAASGAALMIG